jgi:predicted permease
VSNGFWRSRFGGQPWIGTERIGLDSESCAIAGVMPPGFDFPSRTTMFWRPIRFRPDVSSDRRDSYLRVIARLKPGVGLEQARAEMASVSAALARTYPKDNEDVGAVIIHLRDELNDQSRMLLVAMAGAAGCLLLIACTNLASLVVTRATARARELAVRTAMGAGRARLVRQLLTESLVLAVVGGGLGLFVAIAAIPTAARLVPSALPIAEVPRIDIRMLLIAAAATIGTGIGFGVLPALRAARLAGVAGVAESSRTGTSRRSERLRSSLVIAQVSVSIVLLVGAGLLIRTLLRVQATSTGFNTDNVLTMRTMLPWEKYGSQAARVAFYQRVLEKVRILPGVRDAAYTSFLPMTLRGGIWEVAIAGQPVDAGAQFAASSRFVTPDYFRAMGIPLTLGRGFVESDALESEPVAIVSQKFVSQYLSGADPLNRRFTFGPSGEKTIVGVVGDIRVRGLERSSEPQVYLPYQQQPDNATMNYTPKDLVLRLDPQSGAGAWAPIAASVRQIVREVDPLQPITDVRPLSEIVEGETTARAVQVRVLGAFAAFSCLLAAVGLHGLLAFVVSQRTREFGVRLALGADPGQIVALVARRGVMLGLSGVVAGAAVAYAAGRWIESLLVGVSPADAATFSVAIGVSLLITIAGSLPPAIRAARTNPREAIASNQ